MRRWRPRRDTRSSSELGTATSAWSAPATPVCRRLLHLAARGYERGCAGGGAGRRRRIRPQQRLRTAGLCRRDRRAVRARRRRPRGAPVAPLARRRGAGQGARRAPRDRLRSEKRRADGGRVAGGCRGARRTDDIDARLRLRASAACSRKPRRARSSTYRTTSAACSTREPCIFTRSPMSVDWPALPWRRALRFSRTVRRCGSSPARGRKRSRRTAPSRRATSCSPPTHPSAPLHRRSRGASCRSPPCSAPPRRWAQEVEPRAAPRRRRLRHKARA